MRKVGGRKKRAKTLRTVGMGRRKERREGRIRGTKVEYCPRGGDN